MFPLPSLSTATLCALVAYPAVATVAPEIPPYANLGVSGMLGGLLYWSMKHSGEQTSKSLDKVEGAMNGVRTEIAGMRGDLKEGQDKTHDLLAKALFQSGGPK